MRAPLPQFIERRLPGFVLRTLQPEDASAELENWTLDPIIAQMMNAELKPWNVQRQRSFFNGGLSRRDRRYIGIFPEGSGTPIGLYIIKLNIAHRSFVISTLLGDASWRGKNVVNDCTDQIYQMMFVEHGFWKAKANVLPANKAMQWLLGNSPWKREGRLARHLRNAADGARMDVLIYGLTKPDWQAYLESRGALKPTAVSG